MSSLFIDLSLFNGCPLGNGLKNAVEDVTGRLVFISTQSLYFLREKSALALATIVSLLYLNV